MQSADGVEDPKATTTIATRSEPVLHPEVMDRGRSHGARKDPDYWNKGHPYLDRIVLKPLPDAQSRLPACNPARPIRVGR